MRKKNAEHQLQELIFPPACLEIRKTISPSVSLRSAGKFSLSISPNSSSLTALIRQTIYP